MKRAPIILCSVFVVCAAGGVVVLADRTQRAGARAEFESYIHRDGKKEALADIARGTPKWKAHGLPDSSLIKEMNAQLRPLGLEVDWFQGCISYDFIERYANEYNAVIRAHVTAIYGEPAVTVALGEELKRPSDHEENSSP